MTRRLALVRGWWGSSSLTGCPDNPYDYKTWTKKLDDPHEAERAVTKLEQLGDPERDPGARRGMGRSGQAGALPPGHHHPRASADARGGEGEVRHRLREDGPAGELGRGAAVPEEGARPRSTRRTRARSTAPRRPPMRWARPSSPDGLDALIEARGEAGHQEADRRAGRGDPRDRQVRQRQEGQGGRRADQDRSIASRPPHPRTAKDKETRPRSRGEVRSVPRRHRRRDQRALRSARAAAAKTLVLSMYRTPELFTQIRRALVASGPDAKDELRKVLRGKHPEVEPAVQGEEARASTAATRATPRPTSASRCRRRTSTRPSCSATSTIRGPCPTCSRRSIARRCRRTTRRPAGPARSTTRSSTRSARSARRGGQGGLRAVEAASRRRRRARWRRPESQDQDPRDRRVPVPRARRHGRRRARQDRRRQRRRSRVPVTTSSARRPPTRSRACRATRRTSRSCTSSRRSTSRHRRRSARTPTASRRPTRTRPTRSSRRQKKAVDDAKINVLKVTKDTSEDRRRHQGERDEEGQGRGDELKDAKKKHTEATAPYKQLDERGQGVQGLRAHVPDAHRAHRRSRSAASRTSTATRRRSS